MTFYHWMFIVLEFLILAFCILVFLLSDKDVDAFFTIIVVSIAGTVINVVCFGGLYVHNDIKVCKESTKPFHPQIIHVSDSSRKILKYKNRDGNENEIILKDNENNFYLPESILMVDPCDGKITTKKGR